MTALAADRKFLNKNSGGNSRAYSLAVAASTVIYAGALVAINASGYAVPAASTAGLRVIGVAQSKVDNSAGANGAKSVQVEDGIWAFKNDADAITQADVGRACYVQDDQTVQDENGGSAVVAGIVTAVDSSWVWVKVSPEVSLFGAAQFSGIETVTAGALSLNTRSSLLSVTGTQAYSLAAGLFEGQRKTVYCVVAASTPAGTLTPSLLAGGTTLAFNAVEDSVELEWHDATGWNVVTKNSVTLA